MSAKSPLYWIIFSALAIWQLPQFLVSLFMLPFMGKLKVIGNRHFNIAFEGTKMKGGISLGPFAFLSPYLAKHDTYIAHELDGHTVDSRILGPLYLIVIGLPSLLNAEFKFTKCYHKFYTEKWADIHAGLTVDERCNLKWKNKE